MMEYQEMLVADQMMVGKWQLLPPQLAFLILQLCVGMEHFLNWALMQLLALLLGQQLMPELLVIG
jgi:hypothetical protein